jgi:hypothetical protein
MSNNRTGARSVLDSQVKACLYQDYLDGNPNLGHITVMMDIHFVAKVRASITAHHLQQAIS